MTLDDCDQADSCLFISNLLISVDLSTLKSGNSIRDGAIKNQWLESKLFPSAIYKIDELVLPNNNFDSKIDETVVGVLTIRNIEVNIPFSITAYMQDDNIFISGITEVDTTWFGFDAPTKFNAWEVLNPIGIEIDFVAEKSSRLSLKFDKLIQPYPSLSEDYASVAILIIDDKEILFIKRSENLPTHKGHIAFLVVKKRIQIKILLKQL